jgi:hypothetical protein
MKLHALCAPWAVVVVVAFAGSARADLVVPERDACRGKAVGDACGTGSTCQLMGFECQAGSCRRFSTEAECTGAGGCRWEAELACAATPSPPPPPETPAAAPVPAPAPTTAASETPAKPAGESCSSATGAEVFVGALAMVIVGWRRRRSLAA